MKIEYVKHVPSLENLEVQAAIKHLDKQVAKDLLEKQ